MKTVQKLLLVSLFFISISLTAQNDKALALNSSTNSNVGIFQFDSETVDYGTIKQNTDGKRTFTFKNTGNAPIIISKIKASCGCTVATKPNQPIMPGETAEIGVKYATSKVGDFNKSITITSNASESKKVIRIKGNVLKAVVNNLEKSKSVVSN